MTDIEFRSTKIVCTIGPASRSAESFRRLAEAGMDAVRINFSHTSHDEARAVAELTRRTSAETGRPLAVLADLQGPKIRVGELDEPLSLHPDREYLIVPEDGSEEQAHEGSKDGRLDDGGPGEGEPPPIPCTWAGLADEVSPGDRILLDDGRIELRVGGTRGRGILVRALDGGTVSSHKGINLPDLPLRAPSLTEKDRRDVRFAAELDADFVALSFVRRPEDISELRRLVAQDVLVIAKIEKAHAVDHLGGILRAADGVMVARGDLGVELPYEDVPVVQKRILRLAREQARISITATQMLESMTREPRPTRAEVSDVANALLDGTAAVMLSAETATGDYPAEAVETLVRVIRRTEAERGFASGPGETPAHRAAVQLSTAGAVAGAAVEAVERLDSPFLVTFTRSGFTARVVAAQRPRIPILAVTDQPRTWRQLALMWGVMPLLHEGEVSYDAMLDRARSHAASAGLGRPGDRFVVTAGVPFHRTGTTNMMRVEEL